MGKQLTEIINPDGTKTTFAYDADGFRTEKHQIGADGTEEYVVYYIWLNGVLTQQYLLYTMEITIKGEIRRIQVPFFVEFIYDESNQAQGCILNGDAGYLFVRNLQGDVIALADMEGRVMIEYNYDPWGKISYIYFDENGNPSNEIADESLQMITAIFCPLTYRGYNYDFTTGLYYLQSRYYNPEWGRFLNCDDTSILLATQGETHGANLFAYCGNDPVNRVDYTGYECEELIYNLLYYVIFPIALIMQKFDELGLSYVLEQSTANWKLIYDPSGILTYRFQLIFHSYSSGYLYYQESYDFDFYYGDYTSWEYALDGQKEPNTWMIKQAFKQGAKAIFRSLGAPAFIGSIATTITFRPLEQYLKQQKNFAKKSLKYLEDFKKKHPDYNSTMFYAFSPIVWITMNYSTGEPHVYKSYKGDKRIEALI